MPLCGSEGCEMEEVTMEREEGWRLVVSYEVNAGDLKGF